MSSLFSRLKGATSANSIQNNNSQSFKKKVAELESDATPLERMLQNAGPIIRQDGSDKFYGMENFGNTCYCNSIVQALYYSVPFRNHVINFPKSPFDSPNDNFDMKPGLRAQIQCPLTQKSAVKLKGTFPTDSSRKKVPNTGQVGSSLSGQRLEESCDSSESKKKLAMLTGPILEINCESSSSYGMEESTFTALKDIFMAIIQSKSRTGVLSPQRFLEIFKRDNEMFRTSMHQDAHEFYGLVLNAVISNVEDYAQRVNDHSPEMDATWEGSIKHVSSSSVNENCPKEILRTSGTDWVHEIFEGILTSETKCLTCETASQRDETFLDLSIDLDEYSSVTSCLRKFSAEEMLCERNKFHCDNCGGLQEAERRMKIKRLPKILTLHLKRFKYTEDMTKLQKLFHRVVYPYYLRMFNTTDDAEDPDRLYELYAVVVHIGGNAYHGHYVSVIKTQGRGWLLFDDEMVEPVDKDYVRNFFGNKSGMACAYVLFYQETTVEAMRKEQEFEEPSDCVRDLPRVPEGSNAEIGNSIPGNLHQSTQAKTSVQKIPFLGKSEPEPLDGATIEGRNSTAYHSSARNISTQKLSTQSVQAKAMTKDQKSVEKKENKVAQKTLKANKKALVKERKNQAKELRRSLAPNGTLLNVDQNHQSDHEILQCSKTEPTSRQHTKSQSRSHQLNRGIGRSFSFLGVLKNDESSKILQESSKKNDIDSVAEENTGSHSPDKRAKYVKEKFSFISLGRKKSSLFPT